MQINRPHWMLSAGRHPLAKLALSILLGLQSAAAWADMQESIAESLPADTNALTNYLTKKQAANNVPAMALVLFDAGQPTLLSTWGNGVTVDTPFRWGSITKTFTALALLRLVEQGKVSLAQPLREVLPQGMFANPWQRSNPVTLAQLLELSAGFSDLSALEFNYNEPLSLAAAMELNPRSRQALWPPGLQHSYSNSTPGLTAAVIEAVTGERFEEFIRSNVLRPLGMRAASLEPVAGLPGGFKADGKTPIPYWHMTFRAFGALNASAREMAAFLGVLLNAGHPAGQKHDPPTSPAIFSPTTLDRLFRAHTGLAGEGRLPVSYGAGSYGWVSHGHVFYGHGGDADGYRSRYGILPEPERGYAIVINVDNNSLLKGMQRQIEAYLTRELPPPVPPPAPESVDLAQYEGTYYPSSARFGWENWQSGAAPQATLRVVGAELRFSRRGKETRLIPVSGTGLFRRPSDPVATVILARDHAGSLYLQGQLGNFFNLNFAPCPGFIRACVKQ